jgi:hypothetical protein
MTRRSGRHGRIRMRVLVTGGGGYIGSVLKTRKVSFEKAERSLPGFIRKWFLEEELAEVLDAYRQFQLKREHLYSDHFTTLNSYKRLLLKKKIRPDFRWAEEPSS